MKSAIRSPKLGIWPLVRFWLIKRPLRPPPVLRHRLRAAYAAAASKIPPLCVARKLVSGSPTGQPPAPSAEITERARATARVCHGCRRPRSPRFASLENLFRDARRANPQRQNDGSEREGGCRRSFGRRPENCVGKPDGPAPSAKITERARATVRVCHGCRGSFGRRPENCFEKPDGPAPSVKITGASAKTTEASAREAVAEALAVARKIVGKLFREARRASPQRQNNGARACDGAGLPWLSRKLRPSPGKLFREA